MTLTTIIPPEVKDDAFYAALQDVAANNPAVKNILEIGSSSGEGSTEAIVTGVRKRTDASEVSVFCMEVSRQRFFRLCQNYQNDTFVKPYNLSSLAIRQFPSQAEVSHFYHHTRTSLNAYPLETVMGWMSQDIDYIRTNRLDFCGIDFIKEANSLDLFDFSVIDGSEFTGERELQMIWGSKFIALDDVNSFKCFNCYRTLANSVSYTVVSEDLSLRSGFAIFKRNF